ncbi:hypothetical protein BaRGS_00036737 [Batillaria attramentaria]|uniref:DDE Tnp4 domain-containing protein n=1 Tax=Batillaria attramentaria TaxID=370345 RepID=A0ABD0JCB2_9CAEN
MQKVGKSTFFPPSVWLFQKLKQTNQINSEFETRWQFPNCTGAMDGTHIEIVSSGRGSDYYNYANYHSIILLALVDADYRSFGSVLAAMAGLGMPEFFGILRSTKGWKTKH